MSKKSTSIININQRKHYTLNIDAEFEAHGDSTSKGISEVISQNLANFLAENDVTIFKGSVTVEEK
jgi:hypothetical protein